MMVLVFYVQDPETATALNGMPLVQMAVNNSVGEWGIHVITFAIFAFAFSSLIGNYFYAESNLRFIKDDSPVLLTVFRIVCLVIIYFGAVNSFDLAWNLADIFTSPMRWKPSRSSKSRRRLPSGERSGANSCNRA